MAVGLPSDECALNAAQKLLGLEQGQTQIRNIVKTIRPADLCQVGAPATGVIPGVRSTATPIASTIPQPVNGRIDRNRRGLIPPFGGHSHATSDGVRRMRLVRPPMTTPRRSLRRPEAR